VLSELASVLEKLDAYTPLLQLLTNAILQWPRDCDLLLSRARILTYLGRFQEARTDYHSILECEPGHVAALCSTVMQGYGDDIGGLTRIDARLSDDDVTRAQRSLLCYARAHLLEEERRFEEAFDSLREANAIAAAGRGMSIPAKQRGARTVFGDITTDLLERCSGRGNHSERPVFIVGMPRSGTTLTEQILACHPDVYAGGERLFWGEVVGGLVKSAPHQAGSLLEAIDGVHARVWTDAGDDYLRRFDEINGDSMRITDKLPANYPLLPFVRLIFPRARIIHVRRHPLATIASCIRAPFSDPALAFTVEDWARFYGIYEALMDRWRPALGEQMLELQYEDLVGDFPAQARRVVSFVGLDWNNACLHPELNEWAVRTASAQQVRRKVHTGSVSAWRCYEAQLEALRPYVQESCEAVLAPLAV
jgi:tetratricopeptide (TPR) repeat protein